MKEIVKEFLKRKNLVVADSIIQVSLQEELSLPSFLVLVYLENSFSKRFEIELISQVLSMDMNDAMEAFNTLVLKGFVSLDSVKDEMGRFIEVVQLDGLYNKILEVATEKKEKGTKEDIFKVFERELGRTISSMELELINGWLISGVSEEIILGALREAVYNGVSNFRYIDKIIYEWEKKGFKTMDDVKKHMRNRREEKSKDKELSKKEQEILDYDWLDA